MNWILPAFVEWRNKSLKANYLSKEAQRVLQTFREMVSNRQGSAKCFDGVLNEMVQTSPKPYEKGTCFRIPKDFIHIYIYIHSLSVRWLSNSFLFHVSVTSFGG